MEHHAPPYDGIVHVATNHVVRVQLLPGVPTLLVLTDSGTALRRLLWKFDSSRGGRRVEESAYLARLITWSTLVGIQSLHPAARQGGQVVSYANPHAVQVCSLRLGPVAEPQDALFQGAYCYEYLANLLWEL